MTQLEVYQLLSRDYEYKGTPDHVLFAGLASEAGEVLGEYLKEERKDREHKDCTEEMLNELSDVLWYVSRIAARRGATLESLMRRGLIKLEERRLNGKAQ